MANFFSQNAPVRLVLHSRDFSVEKSAFSKFLAKNRQFYRFFDFRLSFAKIFFMPTENRFFGDISVEKSDFFVLLSDHSKRIDYYFLRKKKKKKKKKFVEKYLSVLTWPYSARLVEIFPYGHRLLLSASVY